MYEQKLSENPFDVDSILGCMTCYDTRGDWQRCLNLAEISWPAIDQYPTTLDDIQQTETVRHSMENRQRALKLCAQASQSEFAANGNARLQTTTVKGGKKRQIS